MDLPRFSTYVCMYVYQSEHCRQVTAIVVCIFINPIIKVLSMDI